MFYFTSIKSDWINHIYLMSKSPAKKPWSKTMWESKSNSIYQ